MAAGVDLGLEDDEGRDARLDGEVGVDGLDLADELRLGDLAADPDDLRRRRRRLGRQPAHDATHDAARHATLDAARDTALDSEIEASSGLISFGTSIGATKPCGCCMSILGAAFTTVRAPAGGGGGGGGGGATSSGETKKALRASWLGRES